MRILKISLVLAFSSLAFLSISPSIEFANRSSTVALGSGTEFITAAGVNAWLQQSVVKDLSQGNISAATITYDNAPTDFIVNNSNAIVVNTENIRYNSNALLQNEQDIVNNSNAIVVNTEDIRYNSNALLQNEQDIVNNSNALLYGIENNSNAIVVNTEDIRYNSNALLQNEQDVVNNSNAIVVNTEDISYNSNALLYGIKNNSNTLLAIATDQSVLEGAVRANSRNIVYNSNVILVNQDNISYNSNALLQNEQDIVNNSNALLYGIENNSNAIVVNTEDIRYNSNALLQNEQDIVNNSNAIVKNTEDIKNNSNALLYGIENNSNAIVVNTEDIKNNSNALLYDIENNSNAIVVNTEDIKNNSNALLYGIKNNSNALLFGIKNNSNALLYGIENNSNAIVKNTEDIKNNSNALLYGIKNNSNALVYGIENNSNALLYGIKNNSNALVYGIENNSNALLYGIKNNSNALLFGIKNNSNALLYGIKNNSNALLYGIKNNSHTIELHDQYFETIDHGYDYLGNRTYESLGTGNAKDLEIHQVGTTVYRLNSDIYLSEDHTLTLPIEIKHLDGNGHVINFARENSDGVLILSTDVVVSTTNVVLRGFKASNVSIGSGSNFIFNDGTTIELFESQDLNQTWSFAGNTVLSGFGNNLKLLNNRDRINVVGLDSRLTIQDLSIEDVRFSNMHVERKNSALTLRNVELMLDSDYSFTMGTILFDQDVTVRGTSAFAYETAFGSTIDYNANLHFDTGTTFSYAPARAERDLLIMADASSALFLTGATLHSTTTGLQLTRGTLVLDHKNYLYNQDGAGVATSFSEAVVFGDGASATNDLNVEVLPGGSIDLKSGILVFKNVSA